MAATPEICISGAFRIRADGTWLHDGRVIVRPELVRLFASVLRREASGRYFLVTPAEKVPVMVDDAPFVAVAMEAAGEGAGSEIRLDTNLGERVILGADHPLVLRGTVDCPRPYVTLDNGLEALVARSVYYDLAAHALPGPSGVLGVWSGGVFFPLTPGQQESPS